MIALQLPAVPAMALAAALGVQSLLSPSPAHAQAPAVAKPSGPVSIVLVHGAWADGSSWNDVVPLLLGNGLEVVAVQNPLTSLADDVAAANRAINRQPGRVLLVGHSWGGVVISEAGRNDKVAGLVYVAAFAPSEGESVNDLLANKAFPKPPGLGGIQPDATGYLWMTPQNMTEHFAQDLSVARTRMMAVNQNPINSTAFADKVGVPAWQTKPSWYVVAEQDHMIPPVAQAAMAKKIKATVTTLGTSHTPMLSKPVDVAAVIIAAAQKLSP